MHSLKNRHTFGFSYYAKELIEVRTIEDVFSLSSLLLNNASLILGEGSNTIFLEDFDGTVVINALKGIEYSERNDYFLCRVASGENWHAFVKKCLDKEIFGLENLALIPGSVGAAPIQNIGAYGVEVNEFINSVEYVDLETAEVIIVKNEDCEFDYRDSIFKSKLAGKVFITAVNFAFPKSHSVKHSYAPLNTLNNPSASEVFKKVIATRQEKLPDPKLLGNAGSFFKNPIITRSLYNVIKESYPDVPSFNMDDGQVKLPAAWLIDKIGLKGREYRGVKCHDRQPLVLINLGNGEGSALLELAREIRSKIYAEFGILLENEVRLMGNTQLVDL